MHCSCYCTCSHSPVWFCMCFVVSAETTVWPPDKIQKQSHRNCWTPQLQPTAQPTAPTVRNQIAPRPTDRTKPWNNSPLKTAQPRPGYPPPFQNLWTQPWIRPHCHLQIPVCRLETAAPAMMMFSPAHQLASEMVTGFSNCFRQKQDAWRAGVNKWTRRPKTISCQRKVRDFLGISFKHLFIMAILIWSTAYYLNVL